MSICLRRREFIAGCSGVAARGAGAAGRMRRIGVLMTRGQQSDVVTVRIRAERQRGYPTLRQLLEKADFVVS